MAGVRVAGCLCSEGIETRGELMKRRVPGNKPQARGAESGSGVGKEGDLKKEIMVHIARGHPKRVHGERTNWEEKLLSVQGS